MESIKVYEFLPHTKHLIYFYCRSFLPSQNWILFEIHTETLGTSELLSNGDPRWSSPLLFCFLPYIIYRIERVNRIICSFMSFFKSILLLLPYCKCVLLVLMVEVSSKQSDFFTKVWWPLIRVNIKKSSYQTYNYFTSYPPS